MTSVWDLSIRRPTTESWAAGPMLANTSGAEHTSERIVGNLVIQSCHASAPKRSTPTPSNIPQLNQIPRRWNRSNEESTAISSRRIQ